VGGWGACGGGHLLALAGGCTGSVTRYAPVWPARPKGTPMVSGAHHVHTLNSKVPSSHLAAQHLHTLPPQQRWCPQGGVGSHSAGHASARTCKHARTRMHAPPGHVEGRVHRLAVPPGLARVRGGQEERGKGRHGSGTQEQATHWPTPGAHSVLCFVPVDVVLLS